MLIFATILQKSIFQFNRKIELNFDTRTTIEFEPSLPSRTWNGIDVRACSIEAGYKNVRVTGFNGAESNCRIAHNLGILLMNSNCFAILFSSILVVCSDILLEKFANDRSR